MSRMNTVIRVEPTRKVMIGLMGCLAIFVASGAHANVADGPYYNLWDGGTNPMGDGSPVSVCGTSGCNDALDIVVTTTDLQPAGSGYLDVVLRVSPNEPPGEKTKDYSSAYSTDTGKKTLQNDDLYVNQAKDTEAGTGKPGFKKDFNNAVMLGDLVVDDDGNIRLLLDINELGQDPGKFLNLDEFELHVSTDGLLDTYNPDWDFGGSGDPINATDNTGGFVKGDKNGNATTPATNYLGKAFDMDDWKADSANPGENFDGYGGIRIDNTFTTSGSGDWDVLFLIPQELFANYSTESFIHILATFGEKPTEGYEYPTPESVTQADFEEFAFRTGPNPGDTEIPIPPTSMLLGLGLLGLWRNRRLRR